MFLRNAWYVAAWDHEVTRTLQPVQILGDRIVLYRTNAGAPVALEDACPHRKLPLSMGQIKGDEIECGYHGLVFNSTGQCTRIPGATKIPRVLCVRNYPVVSQYGLVWIWMGEATHAHANPILEIEHWNRHRVLPVVGPVTVAIVTALRTTRPAICTVDQIGSHRCRTWR